VIQSEKATCGRFSKQLIDIGDGKVTTDERGCKGIFCTIIDSQDAFIDQIFSNVHRQYTNHDWLDVFSFLYSVNVYSIPYLFYLYTRSLYSYIKLVIFF
jgi:hypothetical protein